MNHFWLMEVNLGLSGLGRGVWICFYYITMNLEYRFLYEDYMTICDGKQDLQIKVFNIQFCLVIHVLKKKSTAYNHDHIVIFPI